jgi:hypothetical protein
VPVTQVRDPLVGDAVLVNAGAPATNVAALKTATGYRVYRMIAIMMVWVLWLAWM